MRSFGKDLFGDHAIRFGDRAHHSVVRMQVIAVIVRSWPSSTPPPVKAAREIRQKTSSVLDERVPLEGVNKISVEFNLLQYNSRSKRPVHRR
jgi:hypothetical protein